MNGFKDPEGYGNGGSGEAKADGTFKLASQGKITTSFHYYINTDYNYFS